MKTILVTGSNGQLGNEMRVIAAQYPQYNYIFTDVAELDICNEAALAAFFAENKVDFIVNCAAYTAVDKAEEDVETAYKINKDAAYLLAKFSAENEIKLIHISTDYVFDGKSYLPYTEEMPIAPNTVYGKSKAEGEYEILKQNAKIAIIRTSWLYSSFGNNFVKTMLKLGAEKEILTVIFDQIGTPTYAADLAFAVMKVITAQNFVAGIYHFSNEGVCSWYDFTIAIHKAAGITTCKVLPIESKDYPAKTPRPFYSVLNKAKIKATYGIEIPHWEDALLRCIKQLG
ncbi:NAD(P)-dependent oxidoreductase [Bacteroidia bacterium]|nr:NAD(P)-dependent oxidoreductase [Bacteroidia bacterium]